MNTETAYSFTPSLQVKALRSGASAAMGVHDFLWLTCSTGQESSVMDECVTLLRVDRASVRREKGKVVVSPFPIFLTENPSVLWRFRGVENVLFGVCESAQEKFLSSSEAVAVQAIRDAVADVPRETWMKALTQWKQTPVDGTAAAALNVIADSMPAYYVTKKRGGEGHSFDSTTLGRTVWDGMRLQVPSWIATIGRDHTIDLEVHSHLHEKQLFVGVRLHKGSHWKRSGVLASNRIHVSTPLKPNICAGMLSEMTIFSGNIFMDPMAGCGTLAEVAAETNKHRIFCIAGDLERGNVAKIAHNRGLAVHTDAMIDVILWDSSNLPLRDACIDAVASDLPFGKRCGSKANNHRLYPRFCLEMARVLVDNGKCTLLSADRRTLPRSVEMAAGARGCFFKKQRTFSVNVGGLDATTMVLKKEYYDDARATEMQKKWDAKESKKRKRE
jgi:hypothetical protein